MTKIPHGSLFCQFSKVLNPSRTDVLQQLRVPEFLDDLGAPTTFRYFQSHVQDETVQVHQLLQASALNDTSFTYTTATPTHEHARRSEMDDMIS